MYAFGVELGLKDSKLVFRTIHAIPNNIRGFNFGVGASLVGARFILSQRILDIMHQSNYMNSVAERIQQRSAKWQNGT